ncbi:MAG: glycosyltransferase [Phycisphaerae bacterium]|jgi:glycosyltransferase involved in cell wall biosynthesis
MHNQYEIISPILEAKTPVVSVVVITYNHEDYIRQNIESIAGQKTSYDFEIIIGEDCSTDSTREICIELQKQYPDIIRIIYSNTNVGMRTNEQRVMKAARGRYLAICEGDDYWKCENKLQRQYDYLEAHPECAMVYHPTARVDLNGNIFAEPLRPKFGYTEPFDMIKLLSLSCGIHTSAMFFRTEANAGTPPRWFEEAPVGDVPLRLLVTSFGKIGFIDEEMSARRMWVPGSWTDRSNANDWHKRRKRYMQSIRMWNDFDKWTDYKYTKLIAPKKRRLYKKLIRSWFSCCLGKFICGNFNPGKQSKGCTDAG